MSFSGGERDHLFLSSQSAKFTDLAGISGMDSPADGRGLGIWDYDRDGRPDLAVSNVNTPPLHIWHNEIDLPAGQDQMLAVRFVGSARQALPDRAHTNRDGYGAQIVVRAAGLNQLREHRCGEGLASQNSDTLLVGLGSAAEAELEVRWPTGHRQKLARVPAGSLVTCFEDPAESADGSGFSIEPYRRSASPPLSSRYRR